MEQEIEKKDYASLHPNFLLLPPSVLTARRQGDTVYTKQLRKVAVSTGLPFTAKDLSVRGETRPRLIISQRNSGEQTNAREREKISEISKQTKQYKATYIARHLLNRIATCTAGPGTRRKCPQAGKSYQLSACIHFPHYHNALLYNTGTDFSTTTAYTVSPPPSLASLPHSIFWRKTFRDKQ